MTQVPLKLFVSACEASGDQRAAEVILALKEKAPDVEVHAYGGVALRAAGATIHRDLTSLAGTGLGWLGHTLTFWQALRQAPRICSDEGIRHALLVDSGFFNLKLARRLKALNVPVYYYVSPQVWASRPWRTSMMRRLLDRVFCLFPFEVPFLEDRGVRAEFVGHPLVGAFANPRDRTTILQANQLPVSPTTLFIGLQPGSRRHEVAKLGPVLNEVAEVLCRERKDLHFVIPRASTVGREALEACFTGSYPCTIVDTPTADLARVFHAAVTKSGTTVLENTLLGVPQVIVYKASPVTAWGARWLVRVPWLGIVNILANEEVCSECLQENCIPEKILAELSPLLEETPTRAGMLSSYETIAKSLNCGDPARNVAQTILREMHNAT